MDAEDFLDADELQELAGDGPLAGKLDPETLAYKEHCQGCNHHLSWIDTAYICTYECTWCQECHDASGAVCPNCSGALYKRPRRTQPVGRK